MGMNDDFTFQELNQRMLGFGYEFVMRMGLVLAIALMPMGDHDSDSNVE